MRIFKIREFSKWAAQEGVTDNVLMNNKSILEVVHENAKGLYEIGLIDEQKMREFDALCLPEKPASAVKQVKRRRPQNKTSQGVLPPA